MGSTTEDLMHPASSVIDVDGIRVAFQEALKIDNRPLAQVAPETGVAYGTLSAWTNGTYNGNNERIAKQVRTWLTTRQAREQLKKTVRVEPAFVMTPTASRIWELLEFAQNMPGMVLVTGAPGLGKTSAITAYAREAPNVWVITAEVTRCSAEAVLDMLSAALGVAKEHKRVAASRAIRNRLRGTRGLVILDEAQNLTPDARDQIRMTLLDLAGIGVALVGSDGMDRALTAERGRGDYPQFSRRVSQRLKRERPLQKDVDALLDAWGLDVADARKAAAGIAFKPGAMGQMTMTLRMAFALADHRGEEQPTEDDIRRCYVQLGGTV